jgi:hypothetical protein
VCGTKNFVSVRLYSAPQSHWTIVAIHGICAFGEPAQAESFAAIKSDPLPGLGCSTSLERQTAGSLWDAYWLLTSLCRAQRSGCEPVQKSSAKRRPGDGCLLEQSRPHVETRTFPCLTSGPLVNLSGFSEICSQQKSPGRCRGLSLLEIRKIRSDQYLAATEGPPQPPQPKR